jgi:hypothetical protein
MKSKVIYTDAPPEVEEAFAHSKRIFDFSPPPEELVFKTAPKPQRSHSRFSILKKVAAM